MTDKRLAKLLSICAIYFTIFMVYGCSVRPQTGQIIKDIDGNEYHALEIGKQVWLAENLKTTKYNDGSEIPYIADSLTWKNAKAPAYCWFKNSKSTKDSLGAYYNWYVVNTDKVCPIGWHVPSMVELSALKAHLGGEQKGGGALRKTGFNVVYCGLRGVGDGNFYYRSIVSYMWSSTVATQKNSYCVDLPYDCDLFIVEYTNKRNGCSIRCISDSK